KYVSEFRKSILISSKLSCSSSNFSLINNSFHSLITVFQSVSKEISSFLSSSTSVSSEVEKTTKMRLIEEEGCCD
ncbi:5483_t:CDS:1, partial [Cetraspora pellucida]